MKNIVKLKKARIYRNTYDNIDKYDNKKVKVIQQQREIRQLTEKNTTERNTSTKRNTTAETTMIIGVHGDISACSENTEIVSAPAFKTQHLSDSAAPAGKIGK